MLGCHEEKAGIECATWRKDQQFDCGVMDVLRAENKCRLSGYEQMERMSAELDALGGGAVRIGHLDVCVLASAQKGSMGGTISHRNGKVLIRDPGCAGSEENASVRRYAIAKFVDAEGGQHEVYEKFGKVLGETTGSELCL